MAIVYKLLEKEKMPDWGDREAAWLTDVFFVEYDTGWPTEDHGLPTYQFVNVNDEEFRLFKAGQAVRKLKHEIDVFDKMMEAKVEAILSLYGKKDAVGDRHVTLLVGW